MRIWTHITNPNPFRIRLSTLDGDLDLEDVRAANASFPLGLTLNARGDSVVPLDVRIDFSEVSALGSALRRALAGEAIPFRLDGTVLQSIDLAPSRSGYARDHLAQLATRIGRRAGDHLPARPIVVVSLATQIMLTGNQS